MVVEQRLPAKKGLPSKPTQIFLSHTQKDMDFCDFIDKRLFARMPVKGFRSEFEKIEAPSGKTLKGEIEKSLALFLLVGKELVRNQKEQTTGWEHTQNWIAYEIGIASALGRDVWVICDDVPINFPVPHVTDYLPTSPRHEPVLNYMQKIVDGYFSASSVPVHPKHIANCTHEACGVAFHLPVTVQKYESINCPCCLQKIIFSQDFPMHSWSAVGTGKGFIKKIYHREATGVLTDKTGKDYFFRASEMAIPDRFKDLEVGEEVFFEVKAVQSRQENAAVKVMAHLRIPQLAQEKTE